MTKMRKNLLSLLLGITLLIVPIQVLAATTNNTNMDLQEIDWKTYISLDRNINYIFRDKYDEPKTLYTTTYLNMRPFPNTDSEVKEILPPNTKVNGVADYNGWTKIIVVNEDRENEYYYLWNEYLSEEKVKIKTYRETLSKDETSTYTNSKKYLGNFKLTAYCNCSSCCGKWAGGATASGTTPTAGRTVAMGDIPFGTKLLINGNVYTVEDRGTPYGHVDIYFNSHSEALQFGLRYADVYKVG